MTTARLGPERPTIAERVVGVLPLHYVASSTVWAVLFVLIPVALYMLWKSHSLASLDGTISLLVVFLMSVYFPISVRVVRHRVLELEPKLIPLLAGGEAEYHEAFGRATSLRGQILTIIAIALLAVYFIVTTDSLIHGIVIAICAVYVATMVGCLIWFNLLCIYGLYRLSRKPLKFKAFREDSKLGTKPIGSLALSLATTYSAGVVILLIFSWFYWDKSYFDTYLLSVYAVLITAGLVVFILALLRVHFRMAEEKVRNDSLIQSHFDSSTHDLKTRDREDPRANIQMLLSLDIADRKLRAVSTWPFDTSVFGKLVVILLSVVAALIARAVASPFHWGG